MRLLHKHITGGFLNVRRKIQKRAKKIISGSDRKTEYFLFQKKAKMRYEIIQVQENRRWWWCGCWECRVALVGTAALFTGILLDAEAASISYTILLLLSLPRSLSLLHTGVQGLILYMCCTRTHTKPSSLQLWPTHSWNQEGGWRESGNKIVKGRVYVRSGEMVVWVMSFPTGYSMMVENFAFKGCSLGFIEKLSWIHCKITSAIFQPLRNVFWV